MNPRNQILIAMAIAGAGAAAAWGWSHLARWRQKDPNEVERLRRLDVNRRGRITTAEIVDLLEPELAGAATASRPFMVIYKYQVAGVTYEVSQDVSALPAALSASRSLALQTASIKYDPKAPTNSIIACEAWNGMDTPSDRSHNEK